MVYSLVSSTLNAAWVFHDSLDGIVVDDAPLGTVNLQAGA
jgi:hypothetical protein